jgi:hypothetical protein
VARDDWDQWLPLCDGYNAFYGRKGPTALPLEIAQVTWSRFFDAYELVHALVAERDGELLGLTHFLFHRSTIQLEPSCYLQDLFTLESNLVAMRLYDQVAKKPGAVMYRKDL